MKKSVKPAFRNFRNVKNCGLKRRENPYAISDCRVKSVWTDVDS